MRTTNLFTDKQFKVDTDGFCKVFTAHVHKGNEYSVHEFSSRDRLEVFVNKLKRHSYGDVNCSATCYRSTDGGNNWHKQIITSLCF